MNSKQIVALVVLVVLYLMLFGNPLDASSRPTQPTTPSFADCGLAPEPNSLARVQWLLCMSNVSVQQDAAEGR